MSMADFKLHLDVATAAGRPAAIMPPSTYIYQNDLMLKAIESGTYTPQRAREISELADKMFAAHWDVDQQRRRAAAGPNSKLRTAGVWRRFDGRRGRRTHGIALGAGACRRPIARTPAPGRRIGGSKVISRVQKSLLALASAARRA
jgi:hypothetical protein